MILKSLAFNDSTLPDMTLGSKKTQKTVDPEPDWVYIHECHPFKGSLRSAILRTHPWFSRILLSWGSFFDALVRFHLRQKWDDSRRGFPGAAISITEKSQRFFRRAKVRQHF